MCVVVAAVVSATDAGCIAAGASAGVDLGLGIDFMFHVDAAIFS